MRSLQINVASTESSAARTRPRMYAFVCTCCSTAWRRFPFRQGRLGRSSNRHLHASSRTPPRTSRQLYMSVPGAWPDEQCLNSGRFGMGASICDMRNPAWMFQVAGIQYVAYCGSASRRMYGKVDKHLVRRAFFQLPTIHSVTHAHTTEV